MGKRRASVDVCPVEAAAKKRKAANAKPGPNILACLGMLTTPPAPPLPDASAAPTPTDAATAEQQTADDKPVDDWSDVSVKWPRMVRGRWSGKAWPAKRRATKKDGGAAANRRKAARQQRVVPEYAKVRAKADAEIRAATARMQTEVTVFGRMDAQAALFEVQRRTLIPALEVELAHLATQPEDARATLRMSDIRREIDDLQNNRAQVENLLDAGIFMKDTQRQTDAAAVDRKVAVTFCTVQRAGTHARRSTARRKAEDAQQAMRLAGDVSVLASVRILDGDEDPWEGVVRIVPIRSGPRELMRELVAAAAGGSPGVPESCAFYVLPGTAAAAKRPMTAAGRAVQSTLGRALVDNGCLPEDGDLRPVRIVFEARTKDPARAFDMPLLDLVADCAPSAASAAAAAVVRYRRDVEGDATVRGLGVQARVQSWRDNASANGLCDCGGVLVHANSNQASELVCIECGFVRQYLDCSVDSVPYGHHVEVVSSSGYNRANHFKGWLNQMQGRESTEVPQEVIDKVRMQFKKFGTTKVGDVSLKLVKFHLKEIGHPKWYEHAPHIVHKITNIPPPEMAPHQAEKLISMFLQLQRPFDELKASRRRSNFLAYSYTMYKLCELIKADEFLKGLALLKTDDNIVTHDEIWHELCARLGWEFIPTPT